MERKIVAKTPRIELSVEDKEILSKVLIGSTLRLISSPYTGKEVIYRVQKIPKERTKEEQGHPTYDLISPTENGNSRFVIATKLADMLRRGEMVLVS